MSRVNFHVPTETSTFTRTYSPLAIYGSRLQFSSDWANSAKALSYRFYYSRQRRGGMPAPSVEQLIADGQLVSISLGRRIRQIRQVAVCMYPAGALPDHRRRVCIHPQRDERCPDDTLLG